MSRPQILKPSEFDEQKALVQWAELSAGRYPDLAGLYAIPNGAYLGRDPKVRSIIMRKLKETGLRPGVPDLFLPTARGGCHGLYIEMKADSPSARVSGEQKSWVLYLKSQGYRVAVCKGFEAARDCLIEYLEAK